MQDKDKLPAPLKSLDLRSGFKSGIREDDAPSENSDRIIQQTVGITASPGAPETGGGLSHERRHKSVSSSGLSEGEGSAGEVEEGGCVGVEEAVLRRY